MSTLAPRLRCTSSPLPRLFLSTLILVAAAGFTIGCGSSGSVSGPKFSGNTSVTVVVTSTANDQLSEFDVGFLGITLTSQSGNTATLLPTPTPGSGPGAEFVHMNGTAEPLVSASIPQDIYSAATVTLNGAQFVCETLDSSGALTTNTYNQPGGPAFVATVTLPSPITVTGTSMGVSLDLQVSQSASFPACYQPVPNPVFSITPTFSLSALNLSSSPTNSENGRVTGLDGEITAIGTTADTFTLSLPDAEGPRALSISSDSNTVYQGISSFSALTVGTFVDLDGAIQPDGSLLATRIAVEDPSALNILSGPLLSVASSTQSFLMAPREQQGSSFSGIYVNGSVPFDFGSAIFQISGQLTNLQNLPFVAIFDASNMVPGQNVYLTAAAIPQSGPFPPARSMTLMPQTINGTVLASASSGNVTDYTVSLAPYDLFPAFAVQPGQATLLTNPSQVEVYVDSNTQLLNTQPLAAGSTLRFYGLVFNDNGTLRMDCAQVNDGVDFSPAPSASQLGHMAKGTPQQIRRESVGPMQEPVNVITQQSEQ